MEDYREARLEEERRRMVERQLRRRGIRDPRVLAAMERVPRHLFVPPAWRDEAYSDHPLPIEGGQTISQPYIVARMTEALELAGTEKVLEIGTGSGYQTAILAELAREVCTIERIPDLAAAAQARLTSLGYKNIRFFVGDGTHGLPEEAPFDRIIVTGALPRIPEALLEQLSDPGIIVAPVGGRGWQELLQVRHSGGTVTRVGLGECRFVPIIGKEGW